MGYILMPCHKNRPDRLQYSIRVILDMWVRKATKSYHYDTMPREFLCQILCDMSRTCQTWTLQQLIQAFLTVVLKAAVAMGSSC